MPPGYSGGILFVGVSNSVSLPETRLYAFKGCHIILLVESSRINIQACSSFKLLFMSNAPDEVFIRLLPVEYNPFFFKWNSCYTRIDHHADIDSSFWAN